MHDLAAINIAKQLAASVDKVVTDAQRKLNALGFGPLEPNGEFTPETKLALTSFQNQAVANGVRLRPSGTLDDETRVVLDTAYSNTLKASAVPTAPTEPTAPTPAAAPAPAGNFSLRTPVNLPPGLPSGGGFVPRFRTPEAPAPAPVPQSEPAQAQPQPQPQAQAQAQTQQATVQAFKPAEGQFVDAAPTSNSAPAAIAVNVPAQTAAPVPFFKRPMFWAAAAVAVGGIWYFTRPNALSGLAEPVDEDDDREPPAVPSHARAPRRLAKRAKCGKVPKDFLKGEPL